MIALVASPLVIAIPIFLELGPRMTPSESMTPDGVIYVIGGCAGGGDSGRALNGVLVTDDAQTTARGWAVGPILRTPRANLAAGVLGTSIYAIGGGTSCDTERYDRATAEFYNVDFGGRWQPDTLLSSDSTSLIEASMVTLGTGSSLVAVGGLINGSVSDEVRGIFGRRRGWVSLGKLPEPRHAAAVASIGEVLYVVGGFDAYGNASDNVWIGTPNASKGVTGGYTWERMNDLAQPCAAAMMVNANGTLWLAGGIGRDRSKALADVISVDTREKPLRWIAHANLTQSRAYGAAVWHRDAIHILGGENAKRELIATVEWLSPMGTETWEPGIDLPFPRSRFAAVVSLPSRNFVSTFKWRRH